MGQCSFALPKARAFAPSHLKFKDRNAGLRLHRAFEASWQVSNAYRDLLRLRHMRINRHCSTFSVFPSNAFNAISKASATAIPTAGRPTSTALFTYSLLAPSPLQISHGSQAPAHFCRGQNGYISQFLRFLSSALDCDNCITIFIYALLVFPASFMNIFKPSAY